MKIHTNLLIIFVLLFGTIYVQGQSVGDMENAEQKYFLKLKKRDLKKLEKNEIELEPFLTVDSNRTTIHDTAIKYHIKPGRLSVIIDVPSKNIEMKAKMISIDLCTNSDHTPLHSCPDPEVDKNRSKCKRKLSQGEKCIW